MRISRVLLVLTALLSCLSAIAQESSHPNFTGIWKLDPQKSTLDRQSPDSVTLYIHQNDPDFHLRHMEVQHGKSWAWSVHGRTDGKMLELKNREGIKRTHMHWEGPELVLESKINGKNGERKTTIRYSLSDGGKTLTATESNNDHENRWVFTKSG
jgi:hypothetical protein